MLRKTGPGGNLSGVECARCGCAGNFTGHGRYARTVVHRGRDERVTVKRVRCASCRATHAVLPEGVVPYKSHSEAFVLAVLAAWASGASNSQVRESFGISESTRRRMLADSRRRACALLACGASRAAVAAALASAGVGAVPAMHLAGFGTRFAENVRLNNPHARPSPPNTPST
ncbi:MAG: hypothetical protein IJM67_10015 [Atopobiaceae bacterium]|nr:hypothetical protein [Kiritimatiellia bacterium]MBQ6651570.1 hypothetical protein [Atopobiaceae bacterium]